MNYNPIAWIGKLGTFGVAAGIFLGLVLPELASFFRPWLAWTIFAILALTMARVDLGLLSDIIRKPLRICGTTFVIMVAFPILTGFVLQAIGIWTWWPDLALAILIMATAPPLLSAPALIYLIGLDGPLAMATLLGCVTITPITVPLIMSWFAGPALSVSTLDLAFQLFTLIAGAALAAGLFRTIIGNKWIAANTDTVDGLMIIAMFIFAVTFMDGIGLKILETPTRIGTLTTLAFGLSTLFILVLTSIYWSGGRERALTIGIVNGNRSVGLIVAAVAGNIPDLTWTYCALAQFPIYLLPFILKPIAGRLAPRIRANLRE